MRTFDLNLSSRDPDTVAALAARLWEKVPASTADGCWEFQAARTPFGHGMIWFAGGMRRAHRIAYELVRGPIPQGLVIDHLCLNPACCNPMHLEVVTAEENTRRAMPQILAQKGPPFKSHCKRGHPFEGENIVWRRGFRNCRTCERQRWKRHREKAQPETTLTKDQSHDG